MNESAVRPPLPPFTEESARAKVQAAEDAWNSRDPERVALAYTEDSRWRNRDRFLTGRAEIRDFLAAKWERELDYRLRKELWAYTGNRISVRFEYEWHDTARPVVAQPRQRAVGVHPGRPDEPPRGQHQRRPDRRRGPPTPVMRAQGPPAAGARVRPRRRSGRGPVRRRRSRI